MVLKAKMLNPGERIVFSTRTHIKALFGPALTLILVAAIAGYLASLPEDHRNIWWSLIGVVAGLVIAVFSVWPFMKWYTSTYTVTNRRITTHHGVITKTGHDIPLGRISDVAYERDLVDRILRCGTLTISDASDGGSVQLYDIPRVVEAQRLLADLLHGHSGQFAHHDDGT